MKIVADENIPYIKNFFQGDDLILKPGRQITRDDLKECDLLLVRSVTKVDEALLSNTAIKFVGSSATGLDHIDTAWLDGAGIKWFAAEGCNSQAVVEYVISIVAAFTKENNFPDRKMRAGIIGVGKIGAKVVEVLNLLGFDVIYNDPIRERSDSNFISTPLHEFKNLDLISLHVPLTLTGDFPTYHMIDKNFLQNQHKGCVLINTSRGSVINSVDLEVYGEHLYWGLDVWENEPYINFEILELAEIATPHIAGYTLESKIRGLEMIYNALKQFSFITKTNVDYIEYPKKILSFENEAVNWFDVILKIYNPYDTTRIMKQTLIEDNSGTEFDLLRKNFTERNEFKSHILKDVILSREDCLLLEKLGLKFESGPVGLS